MRGLDISAYQRDVPRTWFEMMYHHEGCRLAVIQAFGGGAPGGGLQANPYARASLERAKAAGMMLAAYVIPGIYWADGLENIEPFKDDLLFYALDAEAGHPVTDTQVDGVRRAGLLPIVYTGQGAWQATMGSNIAFRHLPLWDARYRWGPGELPPYTPSLWPADWALESWFVGYGGWLSRVGWQWQGDITVHGVRCDVNLFDDAWIQEVTPLTSEEKTTLDWASKFRAAFAEPDPVKLAAQIVTLGEAEKTALLAELATDDDTTATRTLVGRLNRQNGRIVNLRRGLEGLRDEVQALKRDA